MLNWLFKRGETRSAVPSAKAFMPNFGTPFQPYSESAATSNSIVGACLKYSLDNIIEPPIKLYRTDVSPIEAEESQPLAELIDSPFGPDSIKYGIDWNRCLQVWALGLNLDGNAYAIKGRNGSRFVGLLPIYHTKVQPVFNRQGSVIEKYRIENVDYPVEDVLHIRIGVDPMRVPLGCSSLKSVMRMVLTDNEIAAYQHRIVQSPTPGIVIRIGADMDVVDPAELRKKIEANFGRENQGKPAILHGDYEVDKVGFSPVDLAIEKMAELPEQRITSAFGIPAMVLGIGAGMKHTTYNNMAEASKMAARHHLGPLWNAIETALTQSVLSEWGAGPGRALIFDRKMVLALQEDANEVAIRASTLFKTNVIDRYEAQMMVGVDPKDEDKGVYAWMLSPVAPSLPNDGSTSVAKRFHNV